jgi:hypothetical protein
VLTILKVQYVHSYVLIYVVAWTCVQALLQGDPFTQFNEAPAPGTVSADAPTVNTAGVPAAAASSTSVPVFGAGGLAQPVYPGAVSELCRFMFAVQFSVSPPPVCKNC